MFLISTTITIIAITVLCVTVFIFKDFWPVFKDLHPKSLFLACHIYFFKPDTAYTLINISKYLFIIDYTQSTYWFQAVVSDCDTLWITTTLADNLKFQTGCPWNNPFYFLNLDTAPYYIYEHSIPTVSVYTSQLSWNSMLRKLTEKKIFETRIIYFLPNIIPIWTNHLYRMSWSQDQVIHIFGHAQQLLKNSTWVETCW